MWWIGNFNRQNARLRQHSAGFGSIWQQDQARLGTLGRPQSVPDLPQNPTAGATQAARFASTTSQNSPATSAPPKRATSRMPVGEVTLISVM